MPPHADVLPLQNVGTGSCMCQPDKHVAKSLIFQGYNHDRLS